MKGAPTPEESVAVNVVPMVDIMFLLLLFFMLGADMSHRENVDLLLPEADKAIDQTDPGPEQRYVNVNIHSIRDVTTEAERRDEANWSYQIMGEEFPDYFALVDKLKVVADQQREAKAVPGMNPPRYLSSVKVTIRSDKNAPYGMIQKAMQACASTDPWVGLYMIEVGAARPAPQ